MKKRVQKPKVSLNDQQISDFKEAFSLFDTDGDGTINLAELGSMLSTIGVFTTNAELETILLEADESGTGSINFTSFINYMAFMMHKVSKDRRMQEAFRVFDAKETGSFGAMELNSVIKSLGEKVTKEEIDQMIQQVDTDGDGQIRYEDFVDILKD
jgi:calmodulin